MLHLAQPTSCPINPPASQAPCRKPRNFLLCRTAACMRYLRQTVSCTLLRPPDLLQDQASPFAAASALRPPTRPHWLAGRSRCFHAGTGHSSYSTGQADKILASDPSLPIFSLILPHDSVSSAGTSTPIGGGGFASQIISRPLAVPLLFSHMWSVDALYTGSGRRQQSISHPSTWCYGHGM